LAFLKFLKCKDLIYLVEKINNKQTNNKISNIFNSMKIENKPGFFGFDDNYISFSFLPRFVIWERKGDLVD